MRPRARAVGVLLLAASFAVGSLAGMAAEEALGLDWFDFLDEVALASPRPSPHTEAERGDARTRLLAALRLLPEDRREVLLLHDLEGWTHREIAERMGLPAGTVRSHLHHARRRLRALLPELEEEADG